MDQSFIQEMKTILEEEKQLLAEELGSISTPDLGDHVPGDRNPKFPNYGNDSVGEDSASPAEVSEYSVNVSVTGTLEAQMNMVNLALQRIENESFGICTKCGNDIPEDRLVANPAADVCMNCA